MLWQGIYTKRKSHLGGQVTNKLISSAYGWYLYNAHGDVTALTDDVGEVTYNYEYDPYGVEISEPGAYESMNPYRYCGEYFDAETGFTYLRARYYDAKIGRFISEDPALDGLNWYAYCGNDPVNKIDPSGESAVAIKVGVDVAIIVVDLLSKAAAATASVYLVDVVYNKVTGKKEYYYSSSKEVVKPKPGPKPSMKPKRKNKAKTNSKRKSNITKQTSKVWRKLNNYKGKTKTSGKGKNQKYYQWDNTHNDIEVYNNRGGHLGSMDPNTGLMYKPGVPGRTIKIN